MGLSRSICSSVSASITGASTSSFAPPEALAVAVADVRADNDAELAGGARQPAHRLVIARMEAARDVRAGHDREQLVVGREPFADVGVEVDVHAETMSACATQLLDDLLRGAGLRVELLERALEQVARPVVLAVAEHRETEVRDHAAFVLIVAFLPKNRQCLLEPFECGVGGRRTPRARARGCSASAPRRFGRRACGRSRAPAGAVRRPGCPSLRNCAPRAFSRPRAGARPAGRPRRLYAAGRPALPVG